MSAPGLCTTTGKLFSCFRLPQHRRFTKRSDRYPARAFPGDTLCYVTGMAFAVVGIQAHFSKTLLLFFIPQIFNFVLSAPQLFGILPCPRHRLPRCVSFIGASPLPFHLITSCTRFDPSANNMHPSVMTFDDKPPSKLGKLVLRTFSYLGVTQLTIRPEDGAIIAASNLTILNAFLVRLGAMSEKRLVQTLMGTQILCSVLAFVVRYGLASLVYDGDRR